eukprot:CAMPEP_0206144666 /NCGR_PEP_ID=MMETSP1473-20131121/24796_1 /ASSEMBLY_ACC=CAM_ASM_001109 /TAXON_ID=1461547 /ORGANISM="Stichococcus sp, Strain RCC1054" /LENGTH=292 /DNA_ID=CAMNT_0053540547 /DNA_START=75 /DNA_END=950 /DNA_ORIENTATION=+
MVKAPGKENEMDVMAGKRKDPGPGSVASNKKVKVAGGDDKIVNEVAALSPTTAANRTGRQCQKVDYKEKAGDRIVSSSKLVVKEEKVVTKEKEALADTGAGQANNLRRLLDFSVVDKSGTLQNLNGSDLKKKPLFLSGVVQPADGKTSKETGRRLAKFGPISSWSIDFSKDGAEIQVATKAGKYAVSKPSTAYKSLFQHLAEASEVAAVCHAALVASSGGSPEASLSEVVAKLSRAKVGKSYSSAREALLLNAKFVATQLGGQEGLNLSATPFMKSVLSEARLLAKAPRGGE